MMYECRRFIGPKVINVRELLVRGFRFHFSGVGKQKIMITRAKISNLCAEYTLNHQYASYH